MPQAQRGHGVLGRALSRAQAGRQHAGDADGFVLVAGAAARAGGAEHLPCGVLDQHRAGLRHELAVAGGGQATKKSELSLARWASTRLAAPMPTGGPGLAGGDVDAEHAGAVFALGAP